MTLRPCRSMTPCCAAVSGVIVGNLPFNKEVFWNFLHLFDILKSAILTYIKHYRLLQFGGPDGELAASMRYLSQRYTMPYREVTGTLTDIGTEELAHMEMICAIVYQLTKNLSPEEIERSGFDKYYVDHTLALWPQSAGGVPWSATVFQSKGDPITDLHEDMAAEQKARTTYDNILRLVKDPEVADPIRFLREREIVHYQRFGEAKREDCSKIQRRGKPTNSALLESHYQSEHLQDIGMSRPICCYTSK